MENDGARTFIETFRNQNFVQIKKSHEMDSLLLQVNEGLQSQRLKSIESHPSRFQQPCVNLATPQRPPEAFGAKAH